MLIPTLIHTLLLPRSPVKLKQLVTDDSQLTPRQRMEQRKKKRADEEAEKRKRAAAQNFSEIQQRRERERKKQHVSSLHVIVRLGCVHCQPKSYRMLAIFSHSPPPYTHTGASDSPLGGGTSWRLQWLQLLYHSTSHGIVNVLWPCSHGDVCRTNGRDHCRTSKNGMGKEGTQSLFNCVHVL